MAYRCKHIVEYGLLRGGATLLGLMPYRLALLTGWILAAAIARLAPGLRRRAEQRMRAVLGPAVPDRELRRMSWIAWRNLVFNVIEGLRLHRLDRAWMDRHFDPGDSRELLRQRRQEGRGGIIAVPHMGNWELAGLGCQLHGLPIIVIIGRQRNPLVNAYMRRARERLGILTLERGTDILRPIVRAIKKGRFMAILPDLRMRTPDIAIPFLGSVANLGSGMAHIARMTRSPIYPFLPLRVGWTRHRIETLAPVAPVVTDDKAADIRAMTEAVVRQIEAGIRRYPEQWFWYNARWVLDPVPR